MNKMKKEISDTILWVKRSTRERFHDTNTNRKKTVDQFVNKLLDMYDIVGEKEDKQ